jgi:RNA polymerase sigma-70 factor (ECF subfamily)
MALFVRHEPAIHSFLTALLVNLDDAEEVMQTTSVAMWKKFEQFAAGTSFRNWGFQIARFEAMNFRRKRQRDRHIFSDELVQLLADEAAEHAAQLEEERRVLAHCLAKLDPSDRGLLSGCYREGVRRMQFESTSQNSALPYRCASGKPWDLMRYDDG